MNKCWQKSKKWLCTNGNYGWSGQIFYSDQIRPTENQAHFLSDSVESVCKCIPEMFLGYDTVKILKAFQNK